MTRWKTSVSSTEKNSVHDYDENNIKAITEIRVCLADVMVQLAKLEHRLSCVAQEILARTPRLPEKLVLPHVEERQSELVSVRDLVNELRISRSTFYKLRNRPDFPKPVDFLARRTLFRRAEIWAWLESQRR